MACVSVSFVCGDMTTIKCIFYAVHTKTRRVQFEDEISPFQCIIFTLNTTEVN